MKKSTRSGVYTNQYYSLRLKNQELSKLSFKKTLQKIKKFINLKGPICDLGSGSGFFLKACEEIGIEAIGIEGCKTAINWANKNSANKTIHHNLIKKLPLKNKLFQVVHCNSVLEHLQPKVAKQTISEAYRILKNGGLFVCACPNFFDLAERFPEHVNLYTPTKLRQNLVVNKFKIIYEHLSFNLSLLTPWEKHKEGGKTGVLRRIAKKNSILINILFSPLWLPVRLVNKYLFNWEPLDVFAGSCFFIAQKEVYK